MLHPVHLLAFGALLAVAQAEIPSYIHVCKRNDPKIEQCIINSVNDLRPILIKGIPDLDVPPLEPLSLPEIVVSKTAGFRAVGTDVTVRGASNFVIKSLKADIKNLLYQFEILIPELVFNANYDVNAKILNLNIKGKGPIYANTTDVEGSVILKGHREPKGDYVKFDSLDLKLKMKNYNVRLENLFNGDKNLGEAMNVALNENKRELMHLLRPTAEKVVSNVFLDIANKVSSHFTYDELFPK